MKLKIFIFNPFYENTIILSSKEKNALIFDPGCYEKEEVDEVLDYVRSNDLEVKGIVNTHGHIDHVLGNSKLKSTFKTSLKIPKNELKVFNTIKLYAPQWGITGYQEAKIDAFVEEGDLLELDELSLRAIEIPGHSPGHMIFYEKNEKIIIGGDVLFKESIGRTDLPGGNHADLIRNIQEKVYSLPEEITIFPGHGSETTIGHEKKYNPFVKG